MAFVIANETLSGSEISYSVPSNVYWIKFQCITGDLTIATTSTTGGTWTLEKETGLGFEIESPDIAGQTLYFNGSGKMQIAYLTDQIS